MQPYSYISYLFVWDWWQDEQLSFPTMAKVKALNHIGKIYFPRWERQKPIFEICLKCGKSFQSRPTLCDPMDCSLLQAPLSMGFSRQEYWSVWSFTSPGDLPDPRIDPGLTWQADSLPTALQGKINPKGRGYDPWSGNLGKLLTEWHYAGPTTGGSLSRRGGGQGNSQEKGTGEGSDMSDITQQPNRASLGQTAPKGPQRQPGVLIAPELIFCISRRHWAVSRVCKQGRL